MNGASKAEVAGRLSLALGALNRRIRSTHSDMSLGLVSALATVVDHDGIRPSDVAALEGVAAPSVTRLISGLEQRGLILREPHPEDGRASVLRATPAGKKALAQARAERADRLLALIEDASEFDDGDVETALRVVEALLASSERDEA